MAVVEECVAPDGLEFVQEFVNSDDEDHAARGGDGFGDLELFREWLLGRSLVGEDTHISEADRLRAIEVREAIRTLAFGNHDGTCEPEAMKELNCIAEDLELVIRFRGHHAELEPTAKGVNAVIGRVLSSVFRSMVTGSWERFKACRDETCRWVFYDRSRNKSAAWCSMRSCGNRAKTRTYRERHAQASR